MAVHRSPASRLLRWLALLLAGWVLVTALPVVLLRWVDPPASAFMLRERVGAWWTADESFRFRHEWVDAGDIATSAKLAVIAAEDQKFITHSGFDIESIRAALVEARDGGRVRGASTITQQVAKNLFLWGGQSWIRKGLEAWFTLLIECTWSKRRILEVYLNIAEFGRGIYGVGAAGEAFYGKPASNLNAQEAALLAAVLPNPKRFRVNAASDYVRGRQRWIQGQMRQLDRESLAPVLE